MKRHLFTTTVVAGFALLGITGTSLAATLPAAPINGHTLLPANIDVMYEFNTSAKNPIEEMLIPSIVDSMTTGNNIGLTKDEITTMLRDNVLGFGMEMNPSAAGDLTINENNMYAYLHLSKDNFDKILAEAKKTTTITTESYKGFTIYTNDQSAIVHIQDDLLFLSNSKANLEAALDNMETDNNLAGNVNFRNVMSHNLADSFLTMYVNPQTILNDTSMTEAMSGMPLLSLTNLNQNLLKAILAEGISIAQVDTGFNMGVVVQGDKDKLQQLNMPMDKNNAVPSLYQKLSGTGLMMYSEKYMPKNWVTDLMKVFNVTTVPQEVATWKSDFKKASDIDIDTEVLPYLYGQEMFTIHKTDSLLPAFTYMMKLDENRAGMGNLLVKLDTYIKQEMKKVEDESTIDFFTASLSTVNSTSFYTYTFDLAKLFPPSGEMNLDSNKLLLTLRMGVTSQGDLVISTLPDLNGMLYNGSLTNNTALNTAFTNPNEIVSEVSFFSIDELHNYITALMDEFKAPSEVSDIVNGFLTPWHNVFLKSYADADTVWGTAMATVDVAGLSQYGALFEKMMSSGITNEIPRNPLFPAQKFCDVSAKDWYQSYVTDLSRNNITEGYKDGCFHPDSNVTRAEFTKMALLGAEKAGLSFPGNQSGTSKDFTDINYGNDWFAPFVDQAASNDLVKGFEDGTFHPNAPITRAEAVTILYNMSNRLKGVNVVDQPIESLIQFTDVGKNDWFLTPVTAAFHYGLINGVTADKFEPNRNLTRAEAAKIISKFMEVEMQGKSTGTGFITN